MRKMTGLIVALAAAFGMPGQAANAAPAELPGWMAGAWIAELPDGSWAEEYWTPARSGLMLGAGRSGTGDRIDGWEQTRIERTGEGLRFCALPKGQAGTCFTATKVGEGEVVFENPAHDFPTRVAYRRDGDGLSAEVSGPGGATPSAGVSGGRTRPPGRPQRAITLPAARRAIARRGQKPMVNPALAPVFPRPLKPLATPALTATSRLTRAATWTAPAKAPA